MGGYGIVGGNLPIAAGLGARLRLQGRGRGHRLHVRRRRLQHRQLRRDDEPGGALEAAGRLPGREQPLRDGHLGRAPLGRRPTSRKKAEGYGIPGERVDGMDVLAVREGVAEGIRHGPRGARPTLVEAFTYRYRGHSAADPEVYREREEVEEWQQKDPIETFAERCVEEGDWARARSQEIREQAERDGDGGGRVRRRLARAAARHPLRQPLRRRRPGARLVRGRRAHARSRTAARTSARREPSGRASWPRRAPPTPAAAGPRPTRQDAAATRGRRATEAGREAPPEEGCR